MTIEYDPDARVRENADVFGGDQRRGERRSGRERRGGLRWDPRQTDRRGNGERRAPVSSERGQAMPGAGVTPRSGPGSASP